MYVDITALVWQKVNGAGQYLPVKSQKSNTRIGCERCLRFFKKTLDVYFCLKKLALDVPRFFKFDIE